MTAQPPVTLAYRRSESAVVVPDHLAGELVRLLVPAMTERARDHGQVPSPTAARLLAELYAAAQRHRAGHQSPATGPEPAAEGDRTGQALSVAETAARMGCSAAYVRRLAAAGRIDARKIGGRWIVHPGPVAPPQPHHRAPATLGVWR